VGGGKKHSQFTRTTYVGYLLKIGEKNEEHCLHEGGHKRKREGLNDHGSCKSGAHSSQ